MKFKTIDVVSVYEGHLASPRGVGATLEVLDSLTGQGLFTHQIPDAMQSVAAGLKEQHPWLDEVSPPDYEDNPGKFWTYYIELLEKYGPEIEIDIEPFQGSEVDFWKPLEGKEVIGVLVEDD